MAGSCHVAARQGLANLIRAGHGRPICARCRFFAPCGSPTDTAQTGFALHCPLTFLDHVGLSKRTFHAFQLCLRFSFEAWTGWQLPPQSPHVFASVHMSSPEERLCGSRPFLNMLSCSWMPSWKCSYVCGQVSRKERRMPS